MYVDLNEQSSSEGYLLPPFSGTEVEYVAMDVPGRKRWRETVLVSWNLVETGPTLVAHYNEGYFPAAAVEAVLEAAQRFALPTGS